MGTAGGDPPRRARAGVRDLPGAQRRHPRRRAAGRSGRGSPRARRVATIALTPVEDPSRYGLVRTDGWQRARLPREARARPDRHESHQRGRVRARAGVLDLIEDGQRRLDRARDLSLARRRGPLRARAGGYWSDVGTPESYIAAHHDLLGGRIHSDLPASSRARAGPTSARPSRPMPPRCPVPRRGGSRRGGRRTHRRRQLGRGRCADRRRRPAARRRRAGAGAVGEGAVVDAAVVGPRAQIGAGARIGAGAVVGAGVAIPAGAEMRRGSASSRKELAEPLRGDVRTGRPARGAAARGHAAGQAALGGAQGGAAAPSTISALGGSAIGGSLAEALWRDSLRAPVAVNRAATLPGWVGPGHLVVAVSYSGGTAETLAAARRARERRRRASRSPPATRSAQLTSAGGGKVVRVPGGLPPRAALGSLFGALAAVLEHAGVTARPSPATSAPPRTPATPSRAIAAAALRASSARPSP